MHKQSFKIKWQESLTQSQRKARREVEVEVDKLTLPHILIVSKYSKCSKYSKYTDQVELQHHISALS